MIVGFRTPEKVKLYEARHLVEMTIARQPDLLEGRFAALGDVEAFHGDEHVLFSRHQSRRPTRRQRLGLLQDREIRPDEPIIMIIAYGDPETKRLAIEGGATGLLTKPIDFTLLRAEIDSRLQPGPGI